MTSFITGVIAMRAQGSNIFEFPALAVCLMAVGLFVPPSCLLAGEGCPVFVVVGDVLNGVVGVFAPVFVAVFCVAC